MTSAEGYLEIGGVEILNNDRVVAYMQDCGCPGFVPRSECGCPDETGGPFISPLTDPAPWIHAEAPDSQAFVGLLGFVSFGSVTSRNVVPVGTGGAIVGRMRPRHRRVTVEGFLVATESCGMSFGARWLEDVLAGNWRTEGCAADELRILTCCPEHIDSGEPPSPFRRLLRAGIIDGPTYGRYDAAPGCIVQSVQFQLAAGNPYLWGDVEQSCLDEVALTAGNTVCCLIEAGAFDEVGRLTIEAQAATSVEVTFTPTVGDTCPAAEDPTFTFAVPSMGTGDVLTVDSVSRTVSFHDASANEDHPGLPFLTFSGTFQWFDVHRGASACLCVEAPAGVGASLVTVGTTTREL